MALSLGEDRKVISNAPAQGESDSPRTRLAIVIDSSGCGVSCSRHNISDRSFLLSPEYQRAAPPTVLMAAPGAHRGLRRTRVTKKKAPSAWYNHLGVRPGVLGARLAGLSLVKFCLPTTYRHSSKLLTDHNIVRQKHCATKTRTFKLRSTANES